MNLVRVASRADTLEEIAAAVCSLAHLDLDSLGIQEKMGILSFRCTTCHTTYPLIDLVILKRLKTCSHCESPVKLYGSSNKYGKLRRQIFYRLLDLGIIKVAKEAVNRG